MSATPSPSGASADIGAIREAARQMVRELDLLGGAFCNAELTLSECHLLTELARLGEATASELAERLLLDKSTLSRLVKGLRRRGLLNARSNPADGRKRLLELTDTGRRRVRTIDREAEGQVAAALEFIAPDARRGVIDGLTRYGKALRYARLSRRMRIRPIRRADNAAVARIIREVMTEYGAVGCGFSIHDAEVDAMYEAYPPPDSAFFVIESGGQVLGCGGMGPLQGGAKGVCELRKMYFRPELRGLGAGTRLLQVILEAARKARYRQCYLETLQHMNHARQLYARHGFRPIEGPLGQTGHSSCNHFMVRDL